MKKKVLRDSGCEASNQVSQFTIKSETRIQAQEGKLFAPLAYTKTFAMAAAAGLSITLVPVLMGYFIRGHIMPEHKNPINRILVALYRPFIHLVLQAPKSVLLVALLLRGYPRIENLLRQILNVTSLKQYQQVIAFFSNFAASTMDRNFFLILSSNMMNNQYPTN